MKFASLLLAGVSLGSMYALVASGFVVIYKASTVLNFAHGSLLFAGAYFVVATRGAIGFWPAALLGVAVVAVLALFIERVLVRPLGTASPVSTTIMTIAVDVILFTLLSALLGSDIRSLGQPWGGEILSIGGVGLSLNRLIGFCVAAVLIALLLLAFRLTSWGIEMRAVADDREAAGVVGIRLGRVTMISWGIAGVLAAVAAIFLTGAPTPGLTPALSGLAIAAFPAAVIGGLTSVHGALVGGLLIGIAESLATGYQDELAFLGRGFGAVVPFILLLLVLIVRPDGIFGERRVLRA